MRRMLLPIVLAGLLTAPAAAIANDADGGGQPAHHAAVKACKLERAQIGRIAFKMKYGQPHAFQKCVIAHGGLQNAGNNGGETEHHNHHKHHHNHKNNKDDQGEHAKRHHKDDNGDHNGDHNG